jgi:hypothetical protein
MPMAKRRKKPLNRGPKGGKKHTPGRGHERKSRKRKDERRRSKARKLREALRAEAARQWAVWDSLMSDQKKFRDDLRPKLPRPDHEQ